MIILENLYKSHLTSGHRNYVAKNLNMVFPTGVSVGLLGRNGAGKTTLLRMISGTMEIDSGRIIHDGSVSWPVGFAGSFHGELTGAQNTQFVARIYGVDTDSLVAFVQDFADLGDHFHLPFRTYSSGMRSRLAFGMSMGIKFDTYLVDEVTSVGDADFRKKSKEVFLARMEDSGAIVVSHSMPLMREFCDSGAVLEKGILTYYDDIDEAIAHHNWNMEHTPR